MKTIITEKLSLLHELRILKYKDPREDALRQILSKRKTKIAIENVLHDVFNGKKTLDELIKQEGVRV